MTEASVRFRIALLAVGLTSVLVGCFLISIPVGFLVGGLLATGAGLLSNTKDGG